ncbi:Ser-Thr-rich glycosyl-phosphatidyl-inositol-anchored membrane family-domain-containing protein [Hypoxylon trugodes]|uniref:Ser-Thr-rich glycosyl-phosphatidyl-inositol-anchored membrane family-domain-containing protein n=1 Tax=Hypoxylon trugodes TaxID=326681 RepID=UPI00219F62E0|nr:Ser-Thr-rich glycosyl-phosphatidyl-inositol-anchored membrane family-domain-containing protein [Hypoxylon trugodes]KAI1390298.1 Ser-Thr-rich glycosyl-phosphatidyl-inositol-anchored membrane family-domain-containing protein [Hypoxylon trugodes]
MRSTTIFASALAFAASALAQTAGYAVLTSPAEGEKVASGKTFTIKWEAGKYTGPATISLLGGDSPTTLVPGPTIATVDVADGSFAWNVDCSLGKEKTYGIKVTSSADKDTFQYSFPFAISGPSCSSGAGEYPTLSSSSSSAAGYPTSTPEGYPTSTPEGYPTSTPEGYPTSTPESYPTSSISSSAGYPTSNSTSVSAPSYPTGYPSGNLSTSAYPTTLTSTSVAQYPTGSATTSAPATIPTSGANSAAAGSLALVCGVAFAVLGM